jgi:hypothetical protein
MSSPLLLVENPGENSDSFTQTCLPIAVSRQKPARFSPSAFAKF